MDTSDYKSDTCEIEFLSDLVPIAGEKLIGKTIKKVIAREYTLILQFTDGTRITVAGARWDDCSLGVVVGKTI